MLQAVVPVLRLISLEPLIIKATEGRIWLEDSQIGQLPSPVNRAATGENLGSLGILFFLLTS